MAELDHGAKLALHIDPQGVISLGLPGAIVDGPLPAEAISAQRTVDAAFEATFADGTHGILHVEFEAQPSSDSGTRAARAACALHIATERRVRVVVFYLHPAADGRRPPDRCVLPIGEEPVPITFQARPLWEVDPEVVLGASITGLLPFVPLMRDATLEHVRRTARQILALELPEAARADLAAACLFLARLHFPREQLAGIIPREVLMKSPAYQDLIEDERAHVRAEERAAMLQRTRQLVRSMFEQRFGKDLVVTTAVDRAEQPALDGALLAFGEREDTALLAALRASLGLGS